MWETVRWQVLSFDEVLMIAKYNLRVTYNIIVVAEQSQQNQHNYKQVERWKVFYIKQQQQYRAAEQQRLKADAATQYSLAVAKRYIKSIFAINVSTQFSFTAVVAHNVHLYN